jgi:hypothetical protein
MISSCYYLFIQLFIYTAAVTVKSKCKYPVKRKRKNQKSDSEPQKPVGFVYMSSKAEALVQILHPSSNKGQKLQTEVQP